jgi:hypothetical protein
LGAGGASGNPLASSTLTVENFRKLRHGMSEAEVQAILGSPAESSGGVRIWYDGPLPPKPERPTISLSMNLENGKLDNADLSRFTHSGMQGKKVVMTTDVLATLDQKGVRITGR